MTELRRKAEESARAWTQIEYAYEAELVKPLPITNGERERDYVTGYEAGFKEANQWISCSERLPEDGQMVLCLHKNMRSYVARRRKHYGDGDYIWDDPDDARVMVDSYITHWKEISLPEDLK